LLASAIVGVMSGVVCHQHRVVTAGGGIYRVHETRQLALREQLRRAGKLNHEYLFFKANGAPIRNLQYPYTRWRRTLARLRTIRYRKPYCARHSSVSWDLMIGRGALWVARQHGHSIATMLRAGLAPDVVVPVTLT
jgi:integrase